MPPRPRAVTIHPHPAPPHALLRPRHHRPHRISSTPSQHHGASAPASIPACTRTGNPHHHASALCRIIGNPLSWPTQRPDCPTSRIHATTQRHTSRHYPPHVSPLTPASLAIPALPSRNRQTSGTTRSPNDGWEIDPSSATHHPAPGWARLAGRDHRPSLDTTASATCDPCADGPSIGQDDPADVDSGPPPGIARYH